MLLKEHPLILHIPHSSRVIPPEQMEHYIISSEELDAEMDHLVDYDTEKLFQPVAKEDVQLVFPWSRYLMDVERYEDDKDEVMAKRGMGVFYYRTTDGRPLRRPFSPDEREELLATIYRPWHQQLENIVEEHLRIYDSALIIDGHSFSNVPLPCDLDQKADRPDICLGTDEFHTKAKLILFSVDFFEDKGYEVAVNRPYMGTIVPLSCFGKDSRVNSLMVEVNRKLYGTDAEVAESKNTYRVIERFLRAVRVI